MTNEKEVLFTVDGFDVYKDSQYTTIDKRDGDAPTGFVNAGVSKLPSDGVDSTFHVRCIELENGMHTWDTGFYESSPCYRDMEDSVVKNIVKSRVKNVLDPYRKYVSDNDAFKNGKEYDSFYDKKRFRVKSGRMYSTNNPMDVIDLYISLLAYRICPSGRSGDPKYRDAYYEVVDVSKKKTNREEKLTQEALATSIFMTLLKTDKRRAISILKYIDLKVSDNISDGTLISIFMEYIRGSYDKVDNLLKLFDESESDNGRAMFEIFDKIKSGVNSASTKIARNKNGILYYDDMEIGADIKGAARNIAYKPAFDKIKKQIIISD